MTFTYWQLNIPRCVRVAFKAAAAVRRVEEHAKREVFRARQAHLRGPRDQYEAVRSESRLKKDII